MPVVLVSLTAYDTNSVVDGSVFVDGFASAVSIGDTTGVVDGTIGVSVEGSLFQDAPTVPVVPTVVDGSIFASGDGDMFTAEFSEVDGYVEIDGFASPGNIIDGTIYIDGEASEAINYNGYYYFALEEPEVQSCYVGVAYADAHDTMYLADVPSRLYTQVTREIARLRTVRRGMYDGRATVTDYVLLQDTLRYVLMVLVQENAAFTSEATPTFTALARVINRLVLVDVARSTAEAQNLIAEALVLNSLADAFAVTEALQENVALADLINAVYAAFAAAIDRIVLAESTAPSYALTALLRDTVVLRETNNGEVDLVAALRDSVGFAMTLSFDDGNYTAWVVNTESAGLSTYSNFPFNSFAKIGGRYYGLHTGGLVRLGGDDDDGAPIAAKLRLGMFDFNDRNLKAFSEAYVGASTDGQLLLKAIFVDDATGEKIGAIYRMKARPAAASRETRFELGKGLRAVDWDFELENVDGAMFDLHTIQFQPMTLTRRTRG